MTSEERAARMGELADERRQANRRWAAKLAEITAGEALALTPNGNTARPHRRVADDATLKRLDAERIELDWERYRISNAITALAAQSVDKVCPHCSGALP